MSANLQQQESMRAEPPQIPGAEPVDPAKLPAEFKKFRKDILFFIDTVAYFPNDEMKKPTADRKAVPRVLALTPQAIFVCDTRGIMDRATKVDLIKELYYDTQTVKKLFSTTTPSRVLFKIPEEYDIVVSFEGDDVGAAKAKRFCDVFARVCEYKTFAPVPWRKLDGGERLDDIYHGEPPTHFISPQQIMALNQLRRDFESRVEACKEEYYTVENKLKGVRARVQDKKKEHAAIESSVGSDIATLQKLVEQTRQRKAESQRRVTAAEMELVKTLSDIESLRAQLSEERVNFDTMVQAKVDAGDSPDIQEQVEMKNTLKRSQGRELEKATNVLAAAKAKFARPTYNSAPGPLAQRANELEDKIRAAVDRWERDTSADIKMHQKLEQEADDLQKFVEQLRTLLHKKQAAIDAKKPPKQPAAAVAGMGVGVDGDDDDDLLGGGGGGVPATANNNTNNNNATASLGIDDDLLGGVDGGGSGVGGSSSAPGSQPVADLDDDLLGGGGGAIAPAVGGAGEDLI